VSSLIGEKRRYCSHVPDLGFPRVPIWTIYLSGLPGLFGGNFDVGLAMLFASYTDVMPSATERASLFFLTTSMQFLAQTICPPIGAWLMNLDGKGGTPQVNLAVSTALAILTALIAIFLFPETLHESKKPKDQEIQNQHENNSQESGPVLKDGPAKNVVIDWIRKAVNGFVESVSGLGALNLVLLSLSICFSATGIKAIDWYGLIQYPIIKLHWTFPEASHVISIQGFLMLLHFSLLLPFLNRTAATWLRSSGHAHFAIMAGSCLLLTAGSLLIGFSSTTAMFVTGVMVYSFGEGLPTATQAFIVSLVEKEKVARVMATLSMTSIFGKFMASLLFPKVLALGLDSHIKVLIGLPFFTSAALFVLSSVCFTIVGLKMWAGRRGDTGAGEL
jgi:MFS family permease